MDSDVQMDVLHEKSPKIKTDKANKPEEGTEEASRAYGTDVSSVSEVCWWLKDSVIMWKVGDLLKGF